MLEDAPLSLDDGGGGESLLIAGPPMTGKYALMLRLMAEAGDRGVLITTGDPVEQARADYAEVAGVAPESVGVVDCVSKQQGGELVEDDLVRYASSPKNITDIGMKFTDLYEVFRETEGSVGVGINSLSELLMYLDPQDVYQFVRVLTRQTENEGWTTIAVINSTMHDEQTLHTMYEPFDTVINTREENGARELRVRNRTQTATAWTTF
ncbi:RAD55 family ATPase [Halobaculum rubrum]|uniref:RAD55 family ATPase n=1 Tax=Halobaculum rubrum TaxID=2872158 RepID=UPI001CA3BC81|nr:hypothetical protein [Halobaculum rubrum]QZY00713.1 hypothetical protein K6T25_06470 [Halobaculum rubrum]